MTSAYADRSGAPGAGAPVRAADGAGGGAAVVRNRRHLGPYPLAPGRASGALARHHPPPNYLEN